MIKVPATPAGLGALEELSAAGVTLNVTLIFSERQYKMRPRRHLARGPAAAVAGRTSSRSTASSSAGWTSTPRRHVPTLSPAAQGLVGIVNAKRIWKLNQQFWADKKLPLKQEMIFASTGTKKPEDPPWKYVEAFAGSDIETNPPATNDAVQKSGRRFTRQIDKLPPKAVLDEIDAKVDMQKLEETLMDEGLSQVRRPAERAAQADRDQAGSAARGSEIARRTSRERERAVFGQLARSRSRLVNAIPPHSGGHSWSSPSCSICRTWPSVTPKCSAITLRERATPTS